MFRSASRNLRTWWTAATADVLGGDLTEASEETVWSGVAYHHTHPHRAQLRSHRPRRPGMVPAPPSLCLCPVGRTPTAAPPHAAKPRSAEPLV